MEGGGWCESGVGVGGLLVTGFNYSRLDGTERRNNTAQTFLSTYDGTMLQTDHDAGA